ncbi:hypothetical protein EVAR_96613_1 [Eumeta japonica]|uniref:Uncharacterized protein n=1 Tax=Eumeta variegata TaxID=151549 RepID=A0A4C1WUZ6_EUMVA|nr:hypothetical protein EVAR_96613_1 [Eumeta japonica]
MTRGMGPAVRNIFSCECRSYTIKALRKRRHFLLPTRHTITGNRSCCVLQRRSDSLAGCSSWSLVTVVAVSGGTFRFAPPAPLRLPLGVRGLCRTQNTDTDYKSSVCAAHHYPKVATDEVTQHERSDARSSDKAADGVGRPRTRLRHATHH